jgi:predicted ATP-grasp superfamily ATP-dependent carboligase
VKILAYDHQTAQYGDAHGLLSAAGFSADRALQSLVGDLCRLPKVEVTLLRDATLPALHLPAAAKVIPCAPDQAVAALAACLSRADAVWPVAPESAGALALASADILRHDRMLIGSRPDAVAVFASKHETARRLRAAGVPVVDTFWLTEAQASTQSDAGVGWVVKPDDGAGCSDTRIFPDRDAACAWIAEHDPARYVMQPYIHGRPRSISMVCADGQALLMSINEQRMVVFDNQLHYLGSTVSGVDGMAMEGRALVEQVMAAVPGLWGYAGIDFIMSADGPVVLEVNPRVTISHAGMRQSVGHNPARLVVELLRDGQCAPLDAKRVRPVSVDVNAFPDHTQPTR